MIGLYLVILFDSPESPVGADESEKVLP
jgi:hypothetical protein